MDIPSRQAVILHAGGLNEQSFMNHGPVVNRRATRALFLGAAALVLGRALIADGRATEAPGRLLAELRAGRHDAVISAGIAAARKNASDLSAYSWIFLSLEQAGSPADAASAEHVVQAFEQLLLSQPGEPHYLYALGAAYLKLGDYVRGRERLRASIASGADFWEPYEELVNGYVAEDDITGSAAFLEERLRRSPSNPFLLQAAGVVHYYQSEYREAFDSLDRAFRIFRAQGQIKSEIRCLLNLSDVFTYFNDYPGALDKALTGLKLAEELGDRTLEAQCLERSAFVWHDLGNARQAYDTCSRALALAQELVSRKLEILCYRTMGVIFLERGDLAGAEEDLSRALAYYQRTRSRRQADVCLYWLTLLFRDRGDYAKAMASANEALQISRDIGFKTGEAFHLTTLGDIFLALGDYERALAFNKEALKIAEKYIGKWSREECLNTIGSVYMELQDYAQALASFEEALRYIRQIGHRREEARCLYNVGYASLKLGDAEKARGYFRESLASAQKTGKKIIAASNQNRLGDVYRQMGFRDESKAAYEAAAGLGKAAGQPVVIWEACAGLGALCAAQGEIAAAVEHYKQAVAIIEDIRSQLLTREYSSGFFHSKVPIYEALVNLLFERYKESPSSETIEECLYYVEKAKARTLLDDLQKARAENARLSRVAPSEPCRLAEIRQKLLGGRTGLIEYFVGDENLFVFIITPNRSSVHRIAPPDGHRTLDLAAKYARLLSSKDIENTQVLPAGRKLYDALIGLAGDDALIGLENLIIVPDRSLHYLPFEALVPGQAADRGSARSRFLIEDYGISYAPSASTLISILGRERPKEARADWLAIGNPVIGRAEARAGPQTAGEEVASGYDDDRRASFPPLAYAAREMESIGRLIAPDRQRIVSGWEATEGRVKQLPLGDYRVIHFATHSLLDERVASRSSLFLTGDRSSGEDGFLEAREICEMSLNADLVVLSACQTAGGKMERGEGIEGLARAFFCAGARSVLASLWNVNDESAARFMRDFYRYLTLGKTKQEALRLTRAGMSQARGSRPYYWAAFVLIGEGSAGVDFHRVP